VELAIANITANSTYGAPLQFASNRLKNDPEVILYALLMADVNGWKGEIFAFASEELKGIVGNQNPIECLRSLITKEKLLNKVVESSKVQKKIKI